MLRVDAKQGTPKDGNHLELFHVSIFGCFASFDSGFANVADRNMLILVTLFLFYDFV